MPQIYVQGSGFEDLPPYPVVAQRAPTTNDREEVGTIWIDQPNDDSYILTSFTGGNAIWINAGGGGGVFTTVTASGNITSTTGNISATAGSVSSGTTMTVGTNLTVSGLGLGVVQSSAAGLFSSANGTDGQLFIAGTAVAPAWATVVSGDGSVNIIGGANTLDLRVSGVAASTFPTDAGVATPIAGATTIAGGLNINTAGAGGTVTINLDASPSVTGSLTAGVDLNMTAGDCTITGTTDAAQTIYLRANGGVSETIDIHSDQGTGVNSVNIHSDVGGLTLASGLASDDAINLTASAGGVDIDGAMQVNIASSENTADAIVINSSTGGIDITAAGAVAGEDIDITAALGINITSTENAADCIYLHGNGGITETIRVHSDQGTGAASIHLESDDGGITLTSTALTNDNAIVLNAIAGGVNIDGAMQVNIASAENTADSIVITSAVGGIDILANGAGAAEDIDIQASSSINLYSTENAAQAIYLRANGGATETIDIYSDQGTSVTSVNIHSDDGGITLDSGLASADAINFNTSNAAGGIDSDSGTAGTHMDSTGAISLDAAAASNFTVTGAGIDLTLDSAAGRVVIDGGEAAADAVRINTTNAAGGLDLDTGTGGVIVDTTGAISLDAAAASNFTATGAFDVTINSTAGSVLLDGGEAVVDAINIDASDAAGGIDIDSGTGGITIDSTGAISIDAAAASNFTATGAFDVTLSSTAGSMVIDGGEAVADAVDIDASDAAGGIDIDSGTGGITIDSTGAISIDAAAASNFTATGAFDVTLSSTAGSMVIDGGEAVVDAVDIDASDAAGGIDIDSGTGGITIDSTGAISIDAAAASNFTATGAFDVTLSSTAGSMIIDGGEATADAVQITSSDAAGGVDVNAGTGGVNITCVNGPIDLISGTGNITVGTDVALHNVTVGSTSGASAVTIQSGTGDTTLTSTDDVILTATGDCTVTAGGAVVIDAGADGDILLTPAQNSAAGLTVVLNAKVGIATYTGQTTGSGAQATFVLTNSEIAATSGIIATVANIGGNDARLTLERVEPGAGTCNFMVQNNGAAALNGDVYISFMVLS